MRLHYLSSSTIPSSDANSVQVMHMCEALAAGGHEVTLFAYKTQQNSVSAEEIFEIYGISHHFDLVLRRKLLSSLLGATYIYGLYFAILSLIRGTEVVYGRNLPAVAISTLIGRKSSFEAHMPPSRIWSRLITQLMVRSRHYAGTVVISEPLQKFYLEKLKSPSSINVLPLGARDFIQGPTPRNRAQPTRLIIGYAGSFYKGRGLDLLIQIAQRCPWADFRVAGGTAEVFKKIGEVSELPTNLEVIGRLNPSEVQAFLAQCDVLVAPYQNKIAVSGGGDTSEYFSPLKVFEYMRMGKPIIASNLARIEEILLDQVTGLLCDPLNVDDWCLSLETLRDFPALAESLGQNARADFQKNYSTRTRAVRVAELLS